MEKAIHRRSIIILSLCLLGLALRCPDTSAQESADPYRGDTVGNTLPGSIAVTSVVFALTPGQQPQNAVLQGVETGFLRRVHGNGYFGWKFNGLFDISFANLVIDAGPSYMYLFPLSRDIAVTTHLGADLRWNIFSGHIGIQGTAQLGLKLGRFMAEFGYGAFAGINPLRDSLSEGRENAYLLPTLSLSYIY